MKAKRFFQYLFEHQLSTVLTIFFFYLILLTLNLYLQSTVFGISTAVLIHCTLGFTLGIFSEWCQVYDEAKSEVLPFDPSSLAGKLEAIAIVLVIIFATCTGPIPLTALTIWTTLRSPRN